MANYKFSFGNVAIAEGMPLITPEMHLWIEEQANERLAAALKSVIDEALSMLMANTPTQPSVDELAALNALTVAPMPPLDPGALTTTQVGLAPSEPAPARPERRSKARLATDRQAQTWTPNLRDQWHASERQFRRTPEAQPGALEPVDEAFA